MLIKSGLINKLGKRFPHINDHDINLATQRIIESMISTLSEGGRIEIRGFGSFTLHFRAARRAHNPKTGEKLMTAPKYAVHFKPGKELRDQVNASRKKIPIEHNQPDEE